MPPIPQSILLGAFAVLGFLAGWLFFKKRYEGRHGSVSARCERLIHDAEREAESLLKGAKLEAREELFLLRKSFEEETDTLRQENRRRLEVLDLREENLDKKVAFVDKKEAKLIGQEDDLLEKLNKFREEQLELERILAEQNLKLERIAGMTAENAKHQLMENMVSEARLAAGRSIQQVREETERTARRQSIGILSLAVQRYASEHVAESTVSVVDLPSDDMKGRIIGREGRNIRAFEMATGIDVIIDDTPGAVIVSGFDPVRREIARLSLEILVRDGRIHPGRIEEVVKKTQTEVMEKIRETGEHACLEVGLQNIRPELYPYIGRLDFRTSYGQNLLNHAREVAAVSSVIASELGLDPRLARRCGFLHDIGKAADHEVDGPHAIIGAKLCKKYGENETVINAVGGHHQDVEATSPYTFIISAADAVSASRPGARRESLDSYVQRLENLEAIAESFPGVEKSFAIQAGREVRILVDHHQVSDAEAAVLAEEISRRVEGELEYPGQIRIMVIRETRSTAFAK